MRNNMILKAGYLLLWSFVARYNDHKARKKAIFLYGLQKKEKEK